MGKMLVEKEKRSVSKGRTGTTEMRIHMLSPPLQNFKFKIIKEMRIYASQLNAPNVCNS